MSFHLTIQTAEDRALAEVAAAQAGIAAAIDAHVEAQARALGYNSAANCAGYRDSTVEAWASEALAFIAWRDAVWQEAFQMQAAAQPGQGIPGVEAVLAALPVWPG
ncbi:MAG: hypothetical protein H6898_09820 [Rhodobacter sp.]|nr:hypothetical protein [Paracoccaceae bacterium]MCC0076866.1 hypothetical protein [Rhodobacter sp.]